MCLVCKVYMKMYVISFFMLNFRVRYDLNWIMVYVYVYKLDYMIVVEYILGDYFIY